MTSKRPNILMYTHHYYSAALHRGMAQYAMEAGWSLNTSMYRGGHMVQRRWDGVVGSFDVEDAFYEDFLKPENILAVSLTDTGLLPCVLPDNLAIGRLSAEHLLELGYRNFAFYFWQSKRHELLRAKGLESGLNPSIHAFHRINFAPTPRKRRQGQEVRLRVLRRQLEELPKPIAVMAPMDDLALEVLEICLEAGWEVPRDVGVIGVNNDRLICDFTPVPLSSVDNDEFRIGYEGASLLDRLMQGKPAPKRPILVQPRDIVNRRSTDLLEVSDTPDRFVATAIRFIAENFRKPITSEDVARKAGISKRVLQDRFQHHTGRTLHEQILQKRIAFAKELLRSTDMKTTLIASDVGFNSREGFSRSFKSITGLNPLQFRRQEQR
jgi:LacI family transcriptional regulator